MRFLTDEQISEIVAPSMAPLAAMTADEFLHIRDLGAGGMDDAEIPALCRSNGIDALVSLNVRDFGARKQYYVALNAEGIHVVVLRPDGKRQLHNGEHLALVAGQWPTIQRLLSAASEPLLLRVTMGRVVARTLAELLDEMRHLP